MVRTMTMMISWIYQAGGVTASINLRRSDGQKDAAGDMGMRLLMNIRCKNLSNVLCDWLARKYNTSSRCFVIPGRGSIPLDEESVFNMLGVPRGGIDVPYKVGREVEERLFPQMFP